MFAATTLCLIRHGETDWNAERRYQGHIDIDLNANGMTQAAAAARGLQGERFDALYSSDLSRTRSTAAHLAAATGLPIELVSGLRERHFGLFQGRTAAEVAALDPHAHRLYEARDPDHDFGDGESLRTFSTRVVTTLTRLATAHSGQRLLIVCHGGVLDAVYRRASNMDISAPRDFPLPNAALNWIEICGDHWHILSWADQRHLKDALDEVA